MYKCETCGAQFNTQAESMEHGKMHMGSQMSGGATSAQTFACPTCGMKFGSQAELMDHSKKAHPM